MQKESDIVVEQNKLIAAFYGAAKKHQGYLSTVRQKKKHFKISKDS